MDYQQQQEALTRRAAELQVAYPFLLTRNAKGKIPGGVSANIRRLLRHHWPNLVVSTSQDRSTAGISIEVIYIELPGAPSRDEVKKLLEAFRSERYDIETETWKPDEDMERKAFRKAFGGVSHLTIQSRKATPSELAAALRKAWPAAQKPSSKPRF